MLTPEQIHQIELYYAELLSPAEVAELESSVFADPILRAEAEGIMELLDGFAALELNAFESQLQSWEQKHQKEVPLSEVVKTPIEPKESAIRTFFVKYRLAVAAAIIVLFLPVGYIAFQQFSVQSPEQLYASNFEHFNSLNVVTRAANPMPESGEDPKKQKEVAMQVLLNQGINAYNAQSYKEAATHLGDYIKIADDEKNLDEVLFFLAISELASNNVATAKTIFEDLIENSKIKSYKDGSEWYLALALLKENQAKQSAKLLRQIAGKPKHRYKEKAANLLPKVQKHDR